jgi:hypothetical protein
MAGKSRVRAKRISTARSVAHASAERQAKPVARKASPNQPLAPSDVVPTSAIAMAASVAGLMLLAARSGAPRRFDASAQRTAQAALAQLLAVRLGEDN